MANFWDEDEQQTPEPAQKGLRGLLNRLVPKAAPEEEPEDDLPDLLDPPKRRRMLYTVPDAAAPVYSAEEEARRIQMAREQQQEDSMMLVRNHRLYELWCRMHGELPSNASGARFSLSVFMEDEALPTAEQRGWLSDFNRGLRSTFAYGETLHPKPVDTTVYLRIGADRLSAWLFMVPPSFGGAAPTRQQVETQLAQARITHGVNWDKISFACEAGRYLCLMQIAAGNAPVDGVNGEVFDYYKRQSEINLEVREDDTVNYRDLGWLQTVYEGDVICEITEPIPQADGLSVRGEVLRGRPGRKAAPPVGPGTRLNEKGDAVVAAMDGVLTFANHAFRVDPLLVIQGDVDVETGDLDMVGDIIISGDVRDGFMVWATGNIAVRGIVEGAARLQAGGNIQIGVGISGDSHGMVQAGGKLLCPFIENARVEVTGSIICDAIVNAQVACDDHVLVKTGRGTIVGGHVATLGRVEATVVGNESSRLTTFTLGSSIDHLLGLRDLTEKREAASALLHDIEKNIQFLAVGGPLTVEEEKQLDNLKLSRTVQRRQLSNLDLRLGMMLRHQENSANCALAADLIHPPVQVNIGNASQQLGGVYINAEVLLENGAIDVRNAWGKSML